MNSLNNKAKKKVNKIFYTLAVTFMIGGVSCNKLLDISPPGKLTFEDFWKTKEQATAFIAGLYSNIGSTAYDFKTGQKDFADNAISPVESYIFWGELRGELLSVNPGKIPSSQIRKEAIDNLSPTPGDVSTKYTQFYRIVNNANQAIKYLPEVKKTDVLFMENDEANLSGEAYFIRAFVYFWLVRTFKEIPLVLEPSETDEQNYDLPKSSMDDIYNQIVSDLELAKKNLPDSYAIKDYIRCRATKTAASTVLADVYLWRASLSLTTSEANAYYDKAISNCDEVIQKPGYVLIHGSNYQSMFYMGNAEETILQTFANSTLNNQNNNLKYWFNSRGYFLVTSAADELFNSVGFPDYRSTTPPAGPNPPAGAVTTYIPSSRYIGKYNSSTPDARWIYYRYAEVLLMKAEALSHRYPDDAEQLNNAGELVNEIRKRAFGIENYPKVTAGSTYDMDLAILDERGREFLGEGKRWFELMRFASRNNFEHRELLVDRVLNAVSGVEKMILAPRINNPESWYLPLNADDLSANPNLVQNPYY
jgi:hypothetical protein